VWTIPNTHIVLCRLIKAAEVCNFRTHYIKEPLVASQDACLRLPFSFSLYLYDLLKT
jgi:hypothetical protein